MVAGGDVMDGAAADATGVDCVLGSGPAGVACASELLKHGRTVILVDPGRRLPADRAVLVEEFRRAPDRGHFLERLRALRRDLPAAMQETKLPFSSSYLYDDVERYLPAVVQKAKVARSLASGGLSSVWGATVMPMAQASFRNWPITREEMEPFYRSVAGLMDVPAVQDDLAEIYPNYGNAAPTALSEQGTQLIAGLLNNRSRLAANGIIFGRSRSAIGSSYGVDARGCVYCGLCMYGCPYRAIFNGEYVVDRLKSNPQLTHCNGRIAVGFEERTSGVEVRLRHLDTGAQETLACERLYLACGAATSLRLVAHSQKMFDRIFYLKDTQLVSIPLFLRRRCRPGAIPGGVALGQVLIVLNEPDLCDELIHLQIYGFNPSIADLLRARWGNILGPERLLRPLFEQMMVVMAYLPSQLSARIAVKVSPASTSDAGLGPASFVGEGNPRTQLAVRRIGRKLFDNRRAIGAWPALPLTQLPEPGFSNHLGACLPMRDKPQPGEADRQGRPHGLRRVHVVDGACFSDLPSEHLTYTIMANAMRIAAQATLSDLP
jgi:choline dehydrogenase-like flavoprotein